jgi:hypothetical protein
MLTFWNCYILKLLRFETFTFSDATLSDIYVVLCYFLSQYRFYALLAPQKNTFDKNNIIKLRLDNVKITIKVQEFIKKTIENLSKLGTRTLSTFEMRKHLYLYNLTSMPGTFPIQITFQNRVFVHIHFRP